MKKGDVTLMVLTDYSKAFDPVSFVTVLQKMGRLNIGRNSLHWMVSYLPERRHYVQTDDKTSQLLNVQFGVPQGSILGPTNL